MTDSTVSKSPAVTGSTVSKSPAVTGSIVSKSPAVTGSILKISWQKCSLQIRGFQKYIYDSEREDQLVNY